MRNAFAAELTAIASEDPRVMMLSGDIGNRLFDKFKAAFPERFYNCGVAEQNMMSVAAALASCGLRPIAYTITPFVTMRCLEQIRVDVCYHGLPVVIVGIGAGLSYASLGATHHSMEDVACLRSLPGMSVVCPGDPVETRLALRAALKSPGPVYLRLGKKGEPVVHKAPPDFTIGRGIVLKSGTRVCLLSTGTLLPESMSAVDELDRSGLTTGLVSFHTVKPLDDALLCDVFSRFELVVTIEEHGLIGGLGGAIAEWLCDRKPQKARLCRIGGPDAFLSEAGGQEYARKRLGLDAEGIAARVLRSLNQ